AGEPMLAVEPAVVGRKDDDRIVDAWPERRHDASNEVIYGQDRTKSLLVLLRDIGEVTRRQRGPLTRHVCRLVADVLVVGSAWHEDRDDCVLVFGRRAYADTEAVVVW